MRPQMRGAGNEPYRIACSHSLTSAISSLRSESDEKSFKRLFITVSVKLRLRNNADGA